jgi:hypothetical protein
MQIKLLTLDSSEYTLEEQLMKISEEHHEVLTADNELDRVCEIFDLMQSCKTYIEMSSIYMTEYAQEKHIIKLKLRASVGKIRLMEDEE